MTNHSDFVIHCTVFSTRTLTLPMVWLNNQFLNEEDADISTPIFAENAVV